jgi:hypothetical protein
MNAALMILFVLASTALSAREAPIPDSTSPNKRCHVTVTEMDDRISYRIVDGSTGDTLISIRGSYQPDSHPDDWSFQQSLAATVNWRKDSQFVAIDESNHRRIGTVLIASRGSKGFRQVPLDCDRLMRASKLPWDWGRLFFGKWGAKDTFTVGLIGLLWADPESTPPEKRRRKEASCGFTIALASGRLLAIDRGTDETK